MTEMTRQTTMRRRPSSHISPSTAMAQAAMMISLAILCSSLLAKGQAPPRDSVVLLHCKSHDCAISCRIGSGEMPPTYMGIPGGLDVEPTAKNSRVVNIVYGGFRVTPEALRAKSCTVNVKLGFPAEFDIPEVLVHTDGDARLGEGVSAEVSWHYHFSGEEAEFVQSFDGPFDYRPIDPSHGLDYSDAVKIRTHLAVLPESPSNGSGHVQVKGQEVVFMWA